MSEKEDNITENYLKKIKLFNKYNKFYYDKDSPVVSDELYDHLKKEIIKLEENNIFLKRYNSIHEKVGFKP